MANRTPGYIRYNSGLNIHSAPALRENEMLFKAAAATREIRESHAEKLKEWKEASAVFAAVTQETPGVDARFVGQELWLPAMTLQSHKCAGFFCLDSNFKESFVQFSDYSKKYAREIRFANLRRYSNSLKNAAVVAIGYTIPEAVKAGAYIWIQDDWGLSDAEILRLAKPKTKKIRFQRRGQAQLVFGGVA